MTKFVGFFGTATKSGKKVTTSMFPELKLASTKDKFILNEPARDLMNIKLGDRVLLFDMAGKSESAVSMDTRFFVAKGGVSTTTGVKHGALIGKSGMFAYSEIWSAYLCEDMNVRSAHQQDLIDKGLVVPTENNSVISKKLMFGKLEIAKMEVDGEMVELRDIEIEDGLVSTVYAVTALRSEEHDPRIQDEDELEAEARAEQVATEPATEEATEEVRPSRRNRQE